MATCDGLGHYLIVALPLGLYQVKVSKSGFQKSTRSGIQLNVGQEASIDIRLQVNTIKATVTVSEDAPVVSTRVQRELSPNTVLTVGYVGSHGYHELIGVDANEPVPVICPAAPCPSVYPAWDPSLPTSPTNSPAIGFPIGSPLADTWTWFSEGTSSYNDGLSFRGVYSFSKVLDDGDSLNQTTAGNAPGLVSNPYNLRAD